MMFVARGTDGDSHAVIVFVVLNIGVVHWAGDDPDPGIVDPMVDPDAAADC